MERRDEDLTQRLQQLERAVRILIRHQEKLRLRLWQVALAGLLLMLLALGLGVWLGGRELMPAAPLSTEAAPKRAVPAAPAIAPLPMPAAVPAVPTASDPWAAVREQATANDIPAMMRLARAHETAQLDGGKIQAVRWYEAAAAAGHVPALLELGRLYEAGLDGAPDRASALSWYRQAAGRGSTAGMQALLRLDPPSRRALSRSELRDLQQELSQAGFATGAPDGRLGSRTVTAIRAYQAAVGLPVDGKPSHALRRWLADYRSGQ